MEWTVLLLPKTSKERGKIGGHAGRRRKEKDWEEKGSGSS